MPYFHRNKVLFVHIPKNGGSYVESVLGGTSVKHWHLNRSPSCPSLKSRLLSSIGYTSLKSFLTNKRSQIKDHSISDIFGYNIGKFALQHSTLSEMFALGLVNPSLISKSFCFAVTRDPVQRCLSIYRYWGYSKSMSFEDFCFSVIDDRYRYLNIRLSHTQRTHLRPQSDFLILSSGLIPEWLHLIDLEDLTPFLLKHSTELNWSDFNLSNRAFNKSRQSELSISSDALSVIKRVYHADFELFSY